MLQIVFKALKFFLIFETVRPCCASGLYIYIGAYLSMYTMTYLVGYATQGTQRLKIRHFFFQNFQILVRNLSSTLVYQFEIPPIREPTLTNNFTSSSILEFFFFFFFVYFLLFQTMKRNLLTLSLGVRHGEYHSIIHSRKESQFDW